MSLKINMPKIDLNPQDWIEVYHVLRNHVPEYPVWAFGSRVKWTAKAHSDLDLAIITQQPLSLTRMANIKEAFDESNLSIRVDIVDWATTSEAFRKIIEQDKVVVQAGRESDTENTSDWKSYRLGETGKIVTGKTPLTNNLENQGNEFPFITPADFVGNKWITKTVRTISKIGAESVKNCLIPKKTVLVTYIGSDMGKTALSAMQCVTNQQINSIIVDTHKFLPEFIYYNLSLRQQEIKSMAGGSAVPILKKSAFSDMWIECPNLKTQEEIVDTLSVLDDRIALLRETNTTLEAIAQALFKSWFVDFDPVRAKQQGREPEGMDSATATLFPDSFEESELGLVPSGWRIGTLADVTSVKDGFAYKSKDFGEVGSPVIKIKNIVGDGTVDLLDAQFIADEIAGKTKKFALKDGDIVIAMTGATIGKTGVVVTAGDKVPYLNQRVAKFEPNLQGQDNSWLVFVAFQNNFISEQVVNMASGSAQPNISTSGIESVRLVIPSNHALLEVFNDIVSPLFSGWIANQKQAKNLATLRDTLLPRLISGQLRLPDAEALIEETTA